MKKNYTTFNKIFTQKACKCVKFAYLCTAKARLCNNIVNITNINIKTNVNKLYQVHREIPKRPLGFKSDDKLCHKGRV